MPHQSNRVVAVLAAGIGLLTPSPLFCQTRTPVSEVLPNLFGNTIVLTPSPSPEFPNHAAHFKPGVDQLQTPQQFNQQVVTLLATFPIGSSSGGFTYTFNPSLGTFSRSSESFGPLFAERALTIGRDRGSLGVGFQRSTYDTFEGKNLRQREIVFHVEHIDCCGATQGGVAVGDGTRLNPAFEGDIIETALALRLTTETVVFYGTYGVTDRLDFGVAVPLVSIDMDASIRARIERLATAANPDTHAFDGDNPDEHIFADSGSATGIGDIVVRAKYNFFRARGGGLAAAVDVRTPTGDESNLLGTGGVQTKVYGIASVAFGKLSPHVNAGYTASTKGALPDASLKDEWNYAVGFDLAVSPRLTLIADVLGRSILDAGRLTESRQSLRVRADRRRRRRWRWRWWRRGWRGWRRIRPRRNDDSGDPTRVPARAGQPESRGRQCRCEIQSAAHAPGLGEPAVQSHECGASGPHHAGHQRRLRVLKRISATPAARSSSPTRCGGDERCSRTVLRPATPFFVSNDRTTWHVTLAVGPSTSIRSSVMSTV